MKIKCRARGSGQAFRLILSQSAIQGVPAEISEIRADRKSPGMRTAHWGATKLIELVTQAKTTDYEPGTKRLYIQPGAIRGGQFRIDLHEVKRITGSLVTSIVQTAVPVMMFADGTAELDLRGGTHLPDDLSVPMLEHVFLPFLERELGVHACLNTVQCGFFGEGRASLTTAPLSQPLLGRAWPCRGELRALDVEVEIASGADMDWMKDWSGRIMSELQFHGNLNPCIRVTEVTGTSRRAASILLRADYQHSIAGFQDALFLSHRDHEDVKSLWKKVLRKWLAFHQTGAVFDEHTADMLPMILLQADGTSEYTTTRCTRHLQELQETIRAVFDEERLELSVQPGETTVRVHGTQRHPSSRWTARVDELATAFGFPNHAGHFLQWVDDWSRHYGRTVAAVLREIDRLPRRHAFPRAGILPEELLPAFHSIRKHSQATGMAPAFVERSAAFLAAPYREFAAAMESHAGPAPPADTIKLARLEHSGMSPDELRAKYSGAPVATTILAPTFNAVLNDLERCARLSPATLASLECEYLQMGDGDRRQLDVELEEAWGVAGGLPQLLGQDLSRWQWLKFLSDFGIEQQYFRYLYRQKCLQSWNGARTGPDHDRVLQLWDELFSGRDRVDADRFTERLLQTHETSLEAGQAALSAEVRQRIRASAIGMSDEQGLLHRHQEKVLMKLHRVMESVACGIPRMRLSIRHAARPLLQSIMAHTRASRHAAQGLIFIDEVCNGGETAVIAELICRALHPDARCKFFVLAQTHAELGSLYRETGLVDDVLMEQAVHVLEDAPEMMSCVYRLDREHVRFEAEDYRGMLARTVAAIGEAGEPAVLRHFNRRNTLIEGVLEELALRQTLQAIERLESFRNGVPMPLGRALVLEFVRRQSDCLTMLDMHAIPDAWLSGISRFSNRDYRVIDAQWALLQQFEKRLGELAAAQRDQLDAILQCDGLARLKDDRDMLLHWLDWHQRFVTRVRAAAPDSALVRRDGDTCQP